MPILVTYTAPEGDELATSMCGLDFVSGQAVEVDPAAINPAYLATLRGNRYFEVVEVEPEVKRGPGRPPKVKADAENI